MAHVQPRPQYDHSARELEASQGSLSRASRFKSILCSAHGEDYSQPRYATGFWGSRGSSNRAVIAGAQTTVGSSSGQGLVHAILVELSARTETVDDEESLIEHPLSAIPGITLRKRATGLRPDRMRLGMILG